MVSFQKISTEVKLSDLLKSVKSVSKLGERNNGERKIRLSPRDFRTLVHSFKRATMLDMVLLEMVS
jgi:hypothetical protein